eukprot:gb/GECG01007769.1/.p1 GENE.gb/GECG01007769.1/~~gb/GECG01007769.1/.p1  ORF type:complete len:723 (+),score=64.72 gb/GECG01007769.1/:1-2169(+)
MWNADDCKLDTFAKQWFNICVRLISSPLKLYLGKSRSTIAAKLDAVKGSAEASLSKLGEYLDMQFHRHNFSALDAFSFITYRWVHFAVAILCSHPLVKSISGYTQGSLHEVLPTYITDPLIASALPQLGATMFDPNAENEKIEKDERLDLSEEFILHCRKKRQELAQMLFEEIEVACNSQWTGSSDCSDGSGMLNIPIPFRFAGCHLQPFVEAPSLDQIRSSRLAADDTHEVNQHCCRLPLDVSMSSSFTSHRPLNVPLVSLYRGRLDVEWPLSPFTDRSSFHPGLFVNELIRTGNDLLNLVEEDDLASLKIMLFGDDSCKAEAICSLLNACFRYPQTFSRISIRLYSIPSPEPAKRSALDEYLAWNDPVYRRQVFGAFRDVGSVLPTVDPALGSASAHPQNLNNVGECNENPNVAEAHGVEHYIRSGNSIIPLAVWQVELWYELDEAPVFNSRSERVNSLRASTDGGPESPARHPDLVVPMTISVELGLNCNIELVKQEDGAMPSLTEVVTSKSFRTDGGLGTPRVTLEFVSCNPYGVSSPRRSYFVGQSKFTQIKLVNVPSVEDMNAKGIRKLSEGIPGQSERSSRSINCIAEDESRGAVKEKWSWPADEHTEPSQFSLDLRTLPVDNFTEQSFNGKDDPQDTIEDITDFIRDNASYEKICMLDINRDNNDSSASVFPLSIIIDGKVFKGPFSRIRVSPFRMFRGNNKNGLLTLPIHHYA